MNCAFSRFALAMSVWILAAPAAMAQSGRAIFPPDPYFFATFRDVNGFREGIRQSPGAKMWNEETLAPFRQSMKQSIQQCLTMLRQKDAKSEEDMRNLAELLRLLRAIGQDVDEASLAAYLEPEFHDGRAMSHVIAAIALSGDTLQRVKDSVFQEGLNDAADLPDVWKMLDQRAQDALDAGQARLAFPRSDACVFEATGEPYLGFALIEGLLVAGNDRDWIHALAESGAIEGGVDPVWVLLGPEADRPGLAIVEDLTPAFALMDAMERRLEEPAADPGVGDQAGELEPTQKRAEDLAKLRMVKEALNRAGLTSIERVAAQMTAGPEGFRTIKRVWMAEERAGLMDFPANRAFEIADWSPGAIERGLEFHIRPMRELWTEALTAVQAFYGIAGSTHVDSWMAQIEQRTGVNIRTSLLENLGGDFLMLSTTASTPNLMQPTRGMAAIQAVRPQDVVAAMDNLVDHLSAKAPIVRQVNDDAAGSFTTVSFSMAPLFSLAYGVIDDRFVIANGPEAFTAFAEARRTGGSEESRAALQDSMKRTGLPGQGVGLSFTDWRNKIERLPQRAAAAAPLLSLAAMGASADIQDPARKQAFLELSAALSGALQGLTQMDPAALNRHLFPSLRVDWLDGDVLCSERLSPLPEDMALAGGGIVGGLWMVNVLKAVEKRHEKTAEAPVEAEATPTE